MQIIGVTSVKRLAKVHLPDARQVALFCAFHYLIYEKQEICNANLPYYDTVSAEKALQFTSQLDSLALRFPDCLGLALHDFSTRADYRSLSIFPFLCKAFQRCLATTIELSSMDER